MAVLLDCLLSVLLLSVCPLSRASPSCPVTCRCYSLTVECGSTGLRLIPKNIPPSTQVGPSPCHCFHGFSLFCCLVLQILEI